MNRLADNQWTPIQWSPFDPILLDKMQQDANNLEWVKDTSIRGRYTGSVRREKGVRLLCGIKVIPRSTTARNNVTIDFGEFFSAGCRPQITTGMITPHPRLHHRISGINQLIPDDRGFMVYVQMDNPNTQNNNNVLDAKSYVSWIAVGY